MAKQALSELRSALNIVLMINGLSNLQSQLLVAEEALSQLRSALRSGVFLLCSLQRQRKLAEQPLCELFPACLLYTSPSPRD